MGIESVYHCCFLCLHCVYWGVYVWGYSVWWLPRHYQVSDLYGLLLCGDAWFILFFRMPIIVFTTFFSFSKTLLFILFIIIYIFDRVRMLFFVIQNCNNATDFCIAPRKSIHTLLDIDYVTEWSSSTDGYELTHDAVDYYTHPCATIANQNGTENAYYSSFYHPLSQASAELDQTTDAIISYCARNFSYAVYELRDDLSIIEDNLACTYVHPIYRDMVYNAICDDLMSGLTWSFISLAILMLCGGCILTLRAGVSIRDDVGIMITEEIMRSRSS